MIIVVEDWQRLEASHFVPPADRTAQKRRVVVGVASWILPEGSPRTGQFVVPVPDNSIPSLSRDLCQRRLEIFTHVSEATEKK